MDTNDDENSVSGLVSNDTPNNTIDSLDRGNRVELGDLIEIISPANDLLHETTVLVEYIDDKQINITNIATCKPYQLNINPNGTLTDESIVQINILSRSETKGYARQNNLIPKTWIHIHIGGDIPTLILGEITNLEEDMIEIITYPDIKTIYIDFKYNGIPLDIPITNINIREKPAILNKYSSLSEIRDGLEDGEIYSAPEEELASINYTENGEPIINIPESSKTQKNIHDVLNEMYVDASTLLADEDLGELPYLVEVPENEKRFGIDLQVNDLMDELLSTIPNTRRTQNVMDNIHNLISKYKLLRQEYSKFDDNQNVYNINRMDIIHKPIIQHIKRMDVRLQWLLPVVKLRKRIYDNSNSAEIEDIVTDTTANSLNDLQVIQTEYYERNHNEESRDFDLMQRRIQEIMDPMNSVDKDDCIYSTSVMTDLEAIIDNLDDFNSTVYTKAGLSKRQYVMQRYNLGLSRISNTQLKEGKLLYTQQSLTNNDPLCLNSLMTLPLPIMKFSAIQLRSTNILNRSNYHQNFFMLFRALRANTEVIPHVIEDFEKELDYEKMEETTKQTILNGIHEFIIGDGENMDTDEKFNKFLHCIIPQTRILIKILQKHMHNKLSMISVVEQLEPFMIYMPDISYGQYKEIRNFINNQIKTLKGKLEKKLYLFNILKNTKYNVINRPNIIMRLLAENTDIADCFNRLYDINTDEKNSVYESSNELLFKLIKADYGTLYMNSISQILVSLMTPDSLMAILNEPEIDDMSADEKIKSKDCHTNFLSKRYSSLKELQKDNNVDSLFFDTELDDTPYNIITKYEDEQKRLSPDKFIDFLAENLIQRHDYPKMNAVVLAKDIIAKKKQVLDGHYAVLEIKPQLNSKVDETELTEAEKEQIEDESNIRKKVVYYRRLKNNWVIDADIEDSAFIDTQTLFCNINTKCSNTSGKICESDSDARIRFKNINKDAMVTEFDKRYHESIEDISKKLETKLEYHLKLLSRNKMLREIKEQSANNLAYEIGKRVNNKDSVISPWVKLRNDIIGLSDFVQKQHLICRFVSEFTREPLVKQSNESQYWLYCKSTNTKLFPVSGYHLANTFTSGGDYKLKLNQITAQLGVLSDDGDCILDKETGFKLQDVDFVNADEFDEAGFRISSNDILEDDLGDTLMAGEEKKIKKEFDSETTKMIYAIASTITKYVNIPLDQIETYVLRLSNELIEKHIFSPEAYKRNTDVRKKAVKSYINYKNETTIMIVASVVLISIQTATPSFSVNRTFPGCVKSFSGYPLSGIEDLSGINYISCIVNKIKSSISPWDSIKKLDSSIISNFIKTIIEDYIVKRSDIVELYNKKRVYNELNPEKEIPDYLQLAKWEHFLPPVVNYSVINSLKPVSNDFKTELVTVMKKGNSSQMNKISTLKGRIVSFGYAIIEIVNKVVSKNELLLQTASKIPFVENACCSDSNAFIKPMLYFNNEDGNIQLLLKKTRNMIKLLHYVKDLTYTPSFYHPESTRLIHPEVSSGRIEENIYAAVIYYCNFDKDLPVPEDLKHICNVKPDNYKKEWSIMEKIEFLKRNGKQYNVDTLDNLMSSVNKRNIVTVDPQPDINIISGLTDIIEHMDRVDSTLFDERFREHMRNILIEYNPKQMQDTNSDTLNKFTDYLTISNNMLFTKIMSFFDDYGNLPDAEYDILKNFLKDISNWNADKMYESKEHTYDEGQYTVIQYLYNAITTFSKTYPTMLINNADVFKTIPKHWGLAEKHVYDVDLFLSKYYKGLDEFKGDEILKSVLQDVNVELTDMDIFVKNIPVQTDIQREIIDEQGNLKIISFYSLFGKNALYLLFVHCFYLTISKYIDTGDTPSIVIKESLSNKAMVREHNVSLTDPTTSISALNVNGNDSESVLSEVQIYSDTTTDIKNKIAKLLKSFLQIEINNKKTTNYSYDDIIKRVNMAKEREKKGFMDYLGEMSIENRKSEKLMKKYRLGKWNVGQQGQKRGFKYDKETYERERNELIVQMAGDINSDKFNLISDLRGEVIDANISKPLQTTDDIDDDNENQVIENEDDYGNADNIDHDLENYDNEAESDF